MDTIVHLVTDPLYRVPLRNRLIESGFAAQVFKEQKDDTELSPLSGQIFLVQAHLWPNLQRILNQPAMVAMFGMPAWFHYWFEAVLENTSAYVTPHDSLNVITSSFRQILEGHHYLSDTMERLLSMGKKDIQNQFLDIDLSSHLTHTELEVLELVGARFTTSEIAQKRFRSIHTIKTQRKKIRRKMGVTNGERLAIFAGRKVHALRTLLAIEKHPEMLGTICQNTS